MEIMKQGHLTSSSRNIKSDPSVMPLWKIHEVILERTGPLCQAQRVNTHLRN